MAEVTVEFRRATWSKARLTVPSRVWFGSNMGAAKETPLWPVIRGRTGVMDGVMGPLGLVFSHFCGPMVLPSEL